jgi:2-C-methyl-D-erythritol 4-phosphate cytidylyltransferase
MNIAVIFAGGSGQRMQISDIPKQFIEVYGKPIIIYTLEIFDKHPEIDAIVISCISGWEGHLNDLVKQYGLKKVKRIVKGGDTGQMSIFNGLQAAKEVCKDKKSIVLIHDGVRPFINSDVVSNNIQSVKEHRSAITSSAVKETMLVVGENGKITEVLDRSRVMVAKAPQSFWLNDIYEGHLKAQRDGIYGFIDSCTLMEHYGYPLFLIDGPYENIKITTPEDLFSMRAIIDSKNHIGEK